MRLVTDDVADNKMESREKVDPWQKVSTETEHIGVQRSLTNS